MSMSALNAGMNGINQGLSNIHRNASAIAQAINNNSTDNHAIEQSADVTSALVNLKMNTVQIQASTKVVETMHEMIGSLLDVTA